MKTPHNSQQLTTEKKGITKKKNKHFFCSVLVPWISGGGAGQSAKVTADLGFPKAGRSTPISCNENGGK
jgi:hypothetical protein